jgi:hypothetical protein
VWNVDFKKIHENEEDLLGKRKRAGRGRGEMRRIVVNMIKCHNEVHYFYN